MKKFNTDKIVSVRVNDFFPSPYHKYKKEKKLFGFVIQKEGIYYKFVGSEYVGKETPENHTLEDGIIYENPEVEVNFVDKSRKIFRFNSLEEAKAYADELTNKGKWI